VSDPLVSVVIPCLNEERTIEACVKAASGAIADMHAGGEIIVVDNGSSDHSAEIATAAGARVVRHEVKGYGSALKRGFAEARGRYIIMGDGDLTYDFGALPDFVHTLDEGADLVMGSRLRGSIEPGAMPFLHRWVGTPFLTTVLNVLYKTHISDANCGLRGFSTAAIRNLNLKCNGMEFASEMVVKAAQKRLAVSETPIRYRAGLPDRVPNLHTFRDGWRHLRFMLMLAPRHVFLLPGLIMFAVGLAFSLLFLEKNISLFHIPLGLSAAIFANALLFMGIQIALFGVYAVVYGASLGFTEEDEISRAIRKYFKLEWGLLAGVSLLAFSVVLGLFTIHELLAIAKPLAQVNVPVTELSAISIFLFLLALQIIFSSFYLGLLDLTKTLE
jgi:glycosyltransferase involved in cell wall biosynthesis